MTFQDILKAHKRISGFVHKTPVLTSSAIDSICGRRVFFKAENFQKTGSFKVRGALNATLCYKEHESHKYNGVATHSSGNHGLALAWAASQTNTPCTVVVPHDSSSVKQDAIRGYGEICGRVAADNNLCIIPPYDSENVIAGQGTIGVELLDQVPDLDAILVSTGGGGMAAGIAIATKAIKPACKVFAVEPAGKDLERSLRAGRMMWEGPAKYLDTVADGIRTQKVGEKPWPYFLKNVEKDVFTVEDRDMVSAMKLVFERMKLVIETSAAASVAAVMSDKMKAMDPSIKNVGVILCGGNVDMNHLPWTKI